MGGDHHLRGRRCQGIEPLFLHASRRQPIANDGVVDEFTEDGKRRVCREALGLRDGVADAEAEAVMLCELDFHGVYTTL